MFYKTETICKVCGSKTKYYDSVKRIVRKGYCKTLKVDVIRTCCKKCNYVKRLLPEYLLPYKHYDANIVRGFILGDICENDLEYEDYPCETTIRNWKKSRNLHGIL